MSEEEDKGKHVKRIDMVLLFSWLGIIIVAIIAILMITEVIDADAFFEQCSFDEGFSCEDWRVNEQGIQLFIRNTMASDIEDVEITLDYQDCTQIFTKLNTTKVMHGELIDPELMQFNCTGLMQGKYIKASLELTYRFVGQQKETKKEGVLKAKIRKR